MPHVEDILLSAGLVSDSGLRVIRRFARHHGVPFTQALLESSAISSDSLASALSTALSLPIVDVSDEPTDEDAVREVPFRLAESYHLLPLAVERRANERVLVVAMANPLDVDAIDELEETTGCRVEVVLASARRLDSAIAKHYRGLVTKMIPRPNTPGTPAGDKPNVTVAALVDLLIERGVINHDALDKAIAKLSEQNQ